MSPQINRSSYFYPFMVPGFPCPKLVPELNVSVRIREFRAARVIGAPCIKPRPSHSGVPPPPSLLTVVCPPPPAGAPCIKRAVAMSDDQIVAAYATRLRAALLFLRARFRGRLILRSCHSGTSDARSKQQPPPQFVALQRMNAVLLKVARHVPKNEARLAEDGRSPGLLRA